MKRPLITMLLTLLIGLGSALAQPLATYLPADAVLTFSAAQQDTFGQELLQELSALNWEEAGETLGQLAGYLEASGDMGELRELLDFIQNPDQASAALREFCPAYAEVIDNAGQDEFITSEVLMTVSVNQYAPVPALSGVWRFDEAQTQLVQDAREALLACELELGEASLLFSEQGIDAYILGDGSDLPFIVGSTENLLFFGTDPEVVRGIIRRINGADEANLASTTFYQHTERLQPATGLSFSMNTAALAGILQPFSQFIIDGPETERLVERGLSALRTFGGFVGNVSVTEEGLLFESLITVDPEGGDPELAALLLCETCRVSRPHMAPFDGVAVTSSRLPLRGLFDYVQNWLNDIGAAVGEPLDLREVLREELDLDIDAALLNWVGTDIHTVMLEPVGPNLSTLIYQPAQAFIIPVTDPAVARQGLSELTQALEPFMQEIAQAFNPLSEMQDAPFYGLESTLAQSEYTYRDVTITRNRIGLNTDIGTAFIGNYLVVGMPARALEPLIDTFEGGRSILAHPEYQQVLEATPRQAQSIAYTDDRAWLGGLASLLELLSQPVAFAITGILESVNDYASAEHDSSTDFDWANPEHQHDDFTFDDDTIDLGVANLEGVEAEMLAYPGSASGVLDDTRLSPDGYVSAYYELTGLTPGEQVSVAVTSEEFDTYLYLINQETGEYVDYNDDAPDTSRSEIIFTVEEGVTYWAEVSSYHGGATGEFELTVATPEENVQAPAAAPSLTDVEATPAAPGSMIQGTLDESSFYHESAASAFYELTDLTPGEPVSVVMTSETLDTFLILRDGITGEELASNDDAPDISRSEITFTPEEGVTYWVEATSYHRTGLGDYEFTVSEATAEQAEPMPLSVPGSTLGYLDTDTARFEGKHADYYELTDLTLGEQISVAVTSRDFDTYLYLLDGATGTYIDLNDDAPDTDRSEIIFTPAEDMTYTVVVTSFHAGETGTYELTASSATDPFVDLTAPTFAELLNLTDILPQALRIIQARSSYTEGYTALEDGIVYSRTLMRIRW